MKGRWFVMAYFLPRSLLGSFAGIFYDTRPSVLVRTMLMRDLKLLVVSFPFWVTGSLLSLCGITQEMRRPQWKNWCFNAQRCTEKELQLRTLPSGGQLFLVRVNQSVTCSWRVVFQVALLYIGTHWAVCGTVPYSFFTYLVRIFLCFEASEWLPTWLRRFLCIASSLIQFHKLNRMCVLD